MNKFHHEWDRESWMKEKNRLARGCELSRKARMSGWPLQCGDIKLVLGQNLDKEVQDSAAIYCTQLLDGLVVFVIKEGYRQLSNDAACSEMEQKHVIAGVRGNPLFSTLFSDLSPLCDDEEAQREPPIFLTERILVLSMHFAWELGRELGRPPLRPPLLSVACVRLVQRMVSDLLLRISVSLGANTEGVAEVSARDVEVAVDRLGPLSTCLFKYKYIDAKDFDEEIFVTRSESSDPWSVDSESDEDSDDAEEDDEEERDALRSGIATAAGEDALSKRAGLVFSVGLIKSYLEKDLNPSMDEDELDEIASFLTAILEYLSAELLELAGNAARDISRGVITMTDLTEAIGNDEELRKFFGPFLPAHAPNGRGDSLVCFRSSSFLSCLKDPQRDLLECELAAGEDGERLTDLRGSVWKVLKQVHPDTSLLKMVNKTISGMLLEVYHKILRCLRSLCTTSWCSTFVHYLLDRIREDPGCKDATDQLEALALRLTADKNYSFSPSLIAELKMLLAGPLRDFGEQKTLDILLQLQSGEGGSGDDGRRCGGSASSATRKEPSVQEINLDLFKIALNIVFAGSELKKYACSEGDKSVSKVRSTCLESGPDVASVAASAAASAPDGGFGSTASGAAAAAQVPASGSPSEAPVQGRGTDGSGITTGVAWPN